MFYTTFCPVEWNITMISLRILELVSSRMIKLGQKLIGMHMDAPLERDKAVSWIGELVEFLNDSSTFRGFPKSWDDFIFFGEMISETEPLDKASVTERLIGLWPIHLSCNYYICVYYLLNPVLMIAGDSTYTEIRLLTSNWEL